MFKSKGISSNVLKRNGRDKTRAVSALNSFKNVFGVFHSNRTAKARFDMIVSIILIVPVVSNNVQTIGTITLKRYPDDCKPRGQLRHGP